MGNYDKRPGPGASSASAEIVQRSVGKRSLVESRYPVQRRAGAESPTADGPSSSTGMPGPVQAKMEDSFGFDFSSVRIHQGPQAEAMGAQAYTQGTDIHFAPGKYAPDNADGQALLGHELAHVVQQSQGRVAATTQAKGVDLNDDEGLEREADVAGAQAARGERVTMGGGGGAAGGAPIQAKARGAVIQRAVDSHYGTFTDEKYDLTKDELSIVVKFTPNEKIVSDKIGLTQTVKIAVGGKNEAIDPTAHGRMAAGGQRIDRVSTNNNPIYGSDKQTGKDQGLDKTGEDNNDEDVPTEINPDKTGNATYQLGHRIKNGKKFDVKDAGLHDAPSVLAKKNAEQEFETAALALEGEQANTYLGSVKWGWSTDNKGVATKKPFALASMGPPTKEFFDAAELWNGSTTRGKLTPKADGTNVTDKKGKALFTIDIGDEAIQKYASDIGDDAVVNIEIQGGTHDGKTGFVKVEEMKDVGDGDANIELPIPQIKVTTQGTPLHRARWFAFKHKDLPQGTRVKVTSTASSRSKVEILDGPDTGKKGWIESAALADE